MEWKKEDLDYMKKHYNKDKTIQEIADFFEITYRAVQLKACRMGLTNPRNKLTHEDINFLKNNYKEVSNNEMAKKLNVDPKTIREVLSKLGLENPRSLQTPSRKWTKEEEKFLIENYKNFSQAVLAHYLERTPKSVEKKILNLNLEPKGRPNTCESSLEIKMGKILKDLGMSFVRELKVNERFYVDFFVSDYNLCIEVQGAYFHPRSLEECVTSKQKACYERDLRKKGIILEKGYNLMYVFEEQFKDENSLKKLIINNLPPNLVN